mgnify:CR=1 FL=1
MRAWLRVLVLALVACGDATPERAPGAVGPEPIADHAGAVCGMLVRDQSAPRGQVRHRDGERAHLCSIGDLLAYLEAPSPHGRPEDVWVEVMDPEEDPWDVHPEAHPWVLAQDAIYVVGVRRRQIMGPPVLVYRDRPSAERVAGSEGRVLAYPELVAWWQQRDR